MSRPGRDYTPRKFNKAKPSVDTSMPPPATGRKEIPKPQKSLSNNLSNVNSAVTTVAINDNNVHNNAAEMGSRFTKQRG